MEVHDDNSQSTSAKRDYQALCSDDSDDSDAQYYDCSSSIKRRRTTDPLETILKALSLETYYPKGLSCSDNTTIVTDDSNNDRDLSNLKWELLSGISSKDYSCRDTIIDHYIFGNELTNSPSEEQSSDEDESYRPFHPSDILLLVLLCSNFILRQHLWQQLFLCHIAMPFIVEMEHGVLEMLIWPLRAIDMKFFKSTEEENKGNIGIERSLVKEAINIVSVVRLGEIDLSKSALVNNLLFGDTAHPVFFTRYCPNGDISRTIANGCVEYSVYLPNKNDDLTEPFHILNLRGDVLQNKGKCKIMMKISDIMVLIIDVSFNNQKDTLDFVNSSTFKEKANIIFIVTNRNDIPKDQWRNKWKSFTKQVNINTENVIWAFRRNTSKNIADLKKELVRKMIPCLESPGSLLSLEDSALSVQLDVKLDEEHDNECSEAKRIASDLMDRLHLKGNKISKTDELLLQSATCREIAMLEHKRHQTNQGEEPQQLQNDLIKQQDEKKRKQIEKLKYIHGNSFMHDVINILLSKREPSLKLLVLRWIRIHLDVLSQKILPSLKAANEKLVQELISAEDAKVNKSTLLQIKKKIKSTNHDVDNASFGIEHIMREIGLIYETYQYKLKINQNKKGKSKFKLEDDHMLARLPDTVIDMLLQGMPIELLDGDNGAIQMSWVKCILERLSKAIGNKTLSVISTVGLQSTGKSTLLNTMYGLDFAVSAGRCTRGIFAQLLKVKKQRAGETTSYVLLLDTEGLRAPQLEDDKHQHDNELATLIIGMSHFTMISLMGEISEEMQDILQIVVHAYLRMKISDEKGFRHCSFIHQNVPAIDASSKLRSAQQKMSLRLNKMTQEAAETEKAEQEINSFKDLISFDEESDIRYFPGLLSGSGPMAIINKGYVCAALEIKQYIGKLISSKTIRSEKCSDTTKRLCDMWKAILSDDFVFCFQNTLSISAYLRLGRELTKLHWPFEKELINLINDVKKYPFHSCDDVERLMETKAALEQDMEILYIEYVKDKSDYLKDFIKKDHNSDIMAQWHKGAEDKLQSALLDVFQRKKGDLEVKINACSYELGHKSEKEDLIKKFLETAIEKAKWFKKQKRHVKNAHQSDDDIAESFEKIWSPFEKSIPKSNRNNTDVKSEMIKILKTHYVTQGMAKEFPRDIDKWQLQFVNADIKGGFFSTVFRSNEKFLGHAKQYLLHTDKLTEEIAKKDQQFERAHGQSVMDKIDEELQNDAIFSTNGILKIATTAIVKAIPRFEKMHEDYEKAHGLAAKIANDKNKFLTMFKNMVKGTANDLAAAEQFWAIVQTPLENKFQEFMNTECISDAHKYLWQSKHQFLSNVLEDLAKSDNFTDLLSYIMNPADYAKKRLKVSMLKEIFKSNGSYSYAKKSQKHIEEKFAQLDSLVKTLSDDVKYGKDRVTTQWVDIFCEKVDVIDIYRNDMQTLLSCQIDKVPTFERCILDILTEQLPKLKKKFANVNEHNVQWPDGDPFIKVFNDIWGCPEQCPFCREPCQHDKGHTVDHSCMQHRPDGITGVYWRSRDILSVETCKHAIAHGPRFSCTFIKGKYRQNHNCSEGYHSYKQYKQFFPDWYISPDPADEGSKYWQWFVCTYKDKLVEYHGRQIDIPDYWFKVTKEEALESLNIYSA